MNLFDEPIETVPLVDTEYERVLSLDDGVYENIPDDIYHRLPYCSSTYLRKLIINPAEAQLVEEGEEKKTLLRGRAIHALILEGEEALLDRFVFLPFDAPRKPTSRQINAKKPSNDTIVAIDWWEGFNALNAGKTALDSAEKEIIYSCEQAIFSDPVAMDIFRRSKGQPELTIIFTDSATGLRCKVRIDRFDQDYKAPIDLKSINDARELNVQRSISKYRYATQFGHYMNGCESAGLEVNNFIAVFVQTKPTYLVCGGMMQYEKLVGGKLRAQQALVYEKECRELGFYPNIEIPVEAGFSLFDVYNLDGTVKNYAPLFKVFDPPDWGV